MSRSPQPRSQRILRALRLRFAASGLLCVLGAGAAVAQSLQVQPATIAAASAGFTAKARVVLQNTGAQTLQKVSLSYFSNDGVTVTLDAPKKSTLSPKRQLNWTANIVVPAGAHLPGSVVFDATYKVGGSVSHLYTPLALQGDGGQKLVDATLDGTPDPVSQQRPSAVYLVVTNNLDVPVSVTAKSQQLDGGLKAPVIAPFGVPAHSTGAGRVDLATDLRVTPGTHVMAIDVDVSWTRDGQTDQRHFVLTKPVTVGVFFESELLKALSVPSFLMLPGCLVLFTMQLMLSFGIMGLNNQSNIPNLTVSSPGFWILSLSFSWVFVYVYYLITHVNCLLTYGVEDLGYIWVGSIVFGALLYLAIGWRNREWRKEHVFTNADSPEKVLDKLANNNLGPLLQRVQFKMNNVEMTGYALERIHDNATLVWVSPKIGATWQESKEGQDLKDKFDGIMNGSRNPKELAKLFENTGELAALSFENSGTFLYPYHVKFDAVTGFVAADLVVDTRIPEAQE